MSSVEAIDIFKELEKENQTLSNELMLMRKKMKILIEFKIIFDLHSNKIKQSLKVNEWQTFETLLTKINEFVDSKEMSKNNVDVVINTGQTQPKQLQEVSDSSVGAPIILLNVLYFSI